MAASSTCSEHNSNNWFEKGAFSYFQFPPTVIKASLIDNVSGKCKLCSNGKHAMISGRVRVSSNFLKHLKTAHPTEYCEYERKRKRYEDSVPDNFIVETNDKQRRITVHSSSSSSSQEVVNKLIKEYIVNDVKSLKTVENESFIKLVTGLCPTVSVMNRKTLQDLINHDYYKMFSTLRHEMGKVDFICTTADIWSTDHQNFLRMTAHWLDPSTFARRSALIACVRFKDEPTRDKLQSIIHNVHSKYGIESKIVKICTDNESFVQDIDFEIKCQDPEIEKSLEFTSNFIKGKEISLDCSDDDNYDPEGVQNVITFQSVSNIFEELSEPTLLPYMRCCTSNLKLIAVRDSLNALNDKVYKGYHFRSMEKVRTLWNASRNTKIYGAICDIFGQPTTRWNSFEVIKRIVDAEGSKLNEFCTSNGLQTFLQSEIEFLKEYITLFEPIITALIILQRQQNCYLGFVLPIIKSIDRKISASVVKYTNPLKYSLLRGLKERFDNYFLNEEFLLAAVTHPKFKVAWMEDSDLKNRCIQLLKNACSACIPSEVSLANYDEEKGMCDNEDDTFFPFLSTPTPTTGGKCFTYLNDPERTLQMLNKHDCVKKLFLKFNTIIPSDLPITNLFGTDSIILTKRKINLNEQLFEKLLLLRQNKAYI